MFIGSTAQNRRERSSLDAGQVRVPAAHSEEGTRERVLAHVLRLGPVTAAELGERLDLTPTAVRRHLEWLTDSGDIAPSEPGTRGVRERRGRGRPARAYVVTPAGHRRLDSDSADIATQALRFLAQRSGPQAVEDFARERFAQLEDRYRDRLAEAGDDPHARAIALARELSADGFAASTRPVGIRTPDEGVHLQGVQLCQGHCPMHRVAAEFPQLCEAETAAFARLLGVHVQRLATLSGGEHVCTTFVPTPALGPPPDGRPALPLQTAGAPETDDAAAGSPPTAIPHHRSTQDERTPR